MPDWLSLFAIAEKLNISVPDAVHVDPFFQYIAVEKLLIEQGIQEHRNNHPK